MIVILKDNPDKRQLDNLIAWLESMGLGIHMSEGHSSTIMGLIGDTSEVDIDLISALDIVEAVKRVQEPYKNANR
ncbi:MAG: 3-deoxy-7-phosphoheptulonate synthase, partial [Firmicutes bacterium]|nr:3-deoxy-7-phosphoheptulonate synthase [Bacillota bacterium]